MANRQDSVPFSISFLMKSHDNDTVTTHSLTPPPCFLDGNLTTMLSHDLPRMPEMVSNHPVEKVHQLKHHNVHAMEVNLGDTIKPSTQPTEILSPPPTPASLTAVTSPTPVSQTTISPSRTPIYTDLSHQRLNPAHGRHNHTPPFSLDFLLGTGLHPLKGHQAHHVQHSSSTNEKPDTSISSVRPAAYVSKTPASSKSCRSYKTPNNTKVNTVTSLDESNRSKRNRTSYNVNQLRRLDIVFLNTPYPDTQLYETLSEELDIPTKNLKTWFQNKRARSKRQKSMADRVTDKNSSPASYSVPSYPPPLSSSLHQYPYVVPGTTATSPSTLITPPPSPSPPLHLKQPMAFYPPPVPPKRHSIISSPPVSQAMPTSPPQRLPSTSVSSEAARHYLPPPQPCSVSGLCYDRLSYAEFRDVHDSAYQDTPPMNPSMLSALEKLCSSLPLS